MARLREVLLREEAGGRIVGLQAAGGEEAAARPGAAEAAERRLRPFALGALGAAVFCALRLGHVPQIVRGELDAEGHARLGRFLLLRLVPGPASPAARRPLPPSAPPRPGRFLGRAGPSDRELFEAHGGAAQGRRAAAAEALLAGLDAPSVPALLDQVRADAGLPGRARELRDDNFDLGGPDPAPARAFSALLLSLTNLRRLRLSGFMLHLESLAAALRPMPRLVEVSVKAASCGAEEMGGFLRALAANAPALRRLAVRPGGCLWEPHSIDEPLRAAPSLLPALESLDAGAVRDAAHVLEGLALDAAFCARARCVVLRSQPRTAAAYRTPCRAAALLLRRCPRMRRFGVGMESVAVVYSHTGDLSELVDAAADHPALETLLARTSAEPRHCTIAEPLRRRRARFMADVLDADAWACVEASLVREGGCGRAAEEPIRRLPWHFRSIRDRVMDYVGTRPGRSEGRRAAKRRAAMFHYQIGCGLWAEDAEGEEEWAGSESESESERVGEGL